MDLRDQILQASVELIEREGLAALSMREVARRAGVSHQAPYHYFTDRQEILAAIAGDGFRRLSAALELALQDRKQDALTRLDAAGRAYLRFATTHTGHFRVMFRPELVDLASYPEEEAHAEKAFVLLQQMVSDAVADKYISPGLAEGTVILSWAFVHGLSSLILDGPLGKATHDQPGQEQLVEGAFIAFQKFIRGSRPKKKST